MSNVLLEKSLAESARRFEPSSSSTLPTPVARQGSRRARRIKSIVLLVTGALAGLLAGVDLILFSLLEVVLRGDGDAMLHLPGLASVGWDIDEGVGFRLGLGAYALLVAFAGLGVACSAVFVRRTRPSARRHDALDADRLDADRLDVFEV